MPLILEPRKTIRWWAAWLIPAAGLSAAPAPELPPTNAAPELTLAQCVDRALAHNPDLLIAKKRLEEAAGSLVEARAGALPSLTASGNYQRLEADFGTLNGTAPWRRPELWGVSIRLTEALYAGGAVQGRKAIARLNREARLLGYEMEVDRVLMETRLAFYQVLRSQAEMGVRQQAVEFLEHELARQRQRQEVGTGDRLQAARAEVSLALEKAALVEAENSQREAGLRLSELLSLPGASPLVARGALPYDRQSFDLGQCMDRALALRPEMLLRAHEASVQSHQLKVDRSARLPRVDLFAGYDLLNEPDKQAAYDYYSGVVGGVAVTWQVFDSGLAKGRIKATQARLEAAELARAATRRAVETEVLRAFQDLQQAEQTIATQVKNVSLAREALELARAQVDVGSSTQLELLQARLDLTRAQSTELGARYAYNAALARLQRAISSKFVVLTEPAAPRPIPPP